MEEVTVEEEQIDELLEKAEVLAAIHERRAVESVALGIQAQYHEMLEGQGKGTVKNSTFNRGYMKALNDIFYTLKVLLNHIDGKTEEESEGETDE